jgi:hypothetical protein
MMVVGPDRSVRRRETIAVEDTFMHKWIAAILVAVIGITALPVSPAMASGHHHHHHHHHKHKKTT